MAAVRCSFGGVKWNYLLLHLSCNGFPVFYINHAHYDYTSPTTPAVIDMVHTKGLTWVFLSCLQDTEHHTVC